MGYDIIKVPEIQKALEQAESLLTLQGLSKEKRLDSIVSSLVRQAETICNGAVQKSSCSKEDRDRKIDRILTSKRTGFPPKSWQRGCSVYRIGFHGCFCI